MKPSLLEILRCPNGRARRWRVFAEKVNRSGVQLAGLRDADLLADDDIETGFIADPDHTQIYLIVDFVLVMLADADADPVTEGPLLRRLLDTAPAEYTATIRDKIARLEQASSTGVGDWNRYEMRYYDKEVATPEKRKAFLDRIRRDPLWHIYLERKSQLIDRIGVRPVRRVLEIGCGNARTVAWLFPPGAHAYSYIGTDISLQRLILAKQVLPAGNFVQCSALHLPFTEMAFDMCIAFGVLHHLPDPVIGLREGFDKLRPGGEMHIHEPIEKTSHLIPETGLLRRMANRMFLTYEHSIHDNELSVEQASQMVESLQGITVHRHFSGSLLRTLADRLLQALGPLGQRRVLWQALIGLDQAFLRIFCRTPNRLGPNAVFLIVRKP